MGQLWWLWYNTWALSVCREYVNTLCLWYTYAQENSLSRSLLLVKWRIVRVRKGMMLIIRVTSSLMRKYGGPDRHVRSICGCILSSTWNITRQLPMKFQCVIPSHLCIYDISLFLSLSFSVSYLGSSRHLISRTRRFLILMPIHSPSSGYRVATGER